MRKLSLILIFFIQSNVFSQSLNSYYQTIVSNTSPDTLYHHLISFQNFGVKRIPSTALNNTANWIIGKYQSFGYTDIVRDTFSYSGNELYNIVVTKQGTVFPDKYLIIDSHYDTYNNYIQHSPGANDNGSGVTAMLEIARLLSGVNTAYSIKFITFSAEEVGLVGSQHYVSEVVRTSNMDILLVFNIDEVGGQNGVNNTTINCESDQSAPTYSNVVSADYTDTLSNITELYSTLSTSITNAYGSDYMSFQKDSIVITGFYEYPTSSHYHKTTDIVANMNLPYFYQVTKASVASALYFAKAYQVFTEVDRNSISTGIIVYPNPVSDFLKIIGLTDEKYNLLISDFTGRLIISKQVSGKSCFVDTKQMNSGVFSYSICDMSGRIVKSGKLVRIK